MIRTTLLAFVMLLAGVRAGSAAQCGPLPFMFTDNTLAITAQINADFNFLLTCERGGGLLMQTDASNAVLPAARTNILPTPTLNDCLVGSGTDWTTGACGGGGVTCAGCTINVLPVTTGVGTLGDSTITDAGAGVTIGTPTGGAQGATTVNTNKYFVEGGGVIKKDSHGDAGSIQVTAANDVNVASAFDTVTISGSNATTANNLGGTVSTNGGVGFGSGDGGDDNMIAGNSGSTDGRGGNIYISAGTGGHQLSASLILFGGTNNANTGCASIACGDVFLQAAQAQGASNARGGDLYLAPGVKDGSGRMGRLNIFPIGNTCSGQPTGTIVTQTVATVGGVLVQCP